MFLGHLAVGFGGKRSAPAVSLGALIAAATLADLLWSAFVLAGVERVEIRPGATAVTPLEFTSYPYSHSLVALVIWGALFAGGYALLRRGGWLAPLVLFVAVLSHWVLDVVSHAPDMPVTLGGSTRLGLGLWNSRPATLAVELGLFAVGLVLYARITRARDRVGSIGLWALVALLLLVYGGSFFGPPPPRVAVVAWGNVFGGLLTVALATWVDRHRESTVPAAAR
jgi:hypothetical protein